MAYSVSQVPSSVTFHEAGFDGVRVVEVDGGPPRVRKDRERSNPVADITWNVFGTDFFQLLNLYKSQRDAEWEIQMVSRESGYGTYTCRLLPNTFTWSPNGTAYKITCSVEVMGKV